MFILAYKKNIKQLFGGEIMKEEEIEREVGIVAKIIELERLNGVTSDQVESLLQPISVESIAKAFELCQEKLRSTILYTDSVRRSANVQRTSEWAEKAKEAQREVEEWSERKEHARRILIATMEKWDEGKLAEVALGKDGPTLAKFAFKVLVQKMGELPVDELKKITTEGTKEPIIMRAALDAQVENARITEIQKELGLRSSF
jgi:hypothetical protein